MEYYMEVKKFLPQEFVGFLKNNKIYKEFRNNSSVPIKNNHYRSELQKILLEHFSKGELQTGYDYMMFLTDVFNWEDTKEGWDFWSSVRKKWINMYLYERKRKRKKG